MIISNTTPRRALLNLCLAIGFSSLFVGGCAEKPRLSPVTHGDVMQIDENLVFSLNQNQATTCTAPAPFNVTLLHKHNVKKRDYVFPENSPYNSDVSTGRVPFDSKTGLGTFDDKITMKDDSRVLFIHGIVETINAKSTISYKKYGTWRDNQGCQGTFIDTVQEAFPQTAQVACGT